MITDPMGAEIRPTLHVPFRDYDELLKENKRLREALELIVKLDAEWNANKMGSVQLQRKRWRYMAEKAHLALDTERGS